MSIGLFKDEGKLSPEYVPLRLPHREPQVNELSKMFRSMIESPGSMFIKAWLVGGVGTGKTATSKRFGHLLEREALRRGVNLRYLHVNCYRDRTLFVVAKRMAQRVLPSVPERGFSAQELLDMAWRALEDQEAYMLVVLDEVDYLVKLSGESSLYSLLRLSDERLNVPQRLSMVMVSRSHPSTYLLSDAVVSSSTRNIIKFEPYTSRQLLDILRDRVEEAFVEGVVEDEALTMIADLAGVDGHGTGDARFALELLWRAGKLAEMKGFKRVKPELVREAYVEAHPLINKGDLRSLTKHELLLLLAVARRLKKTGRAYTSTGEVEQEYIGLCSSMGERPRKHTQVWSLLKKLSAMGFVTSKVSTTARGRTTLIGLLDIPIPILESAIMEVLRG